MANTNNKDSMLNVNTTMTTTAEPVTSMEKTRNLITMLVFLALTFGLFLGFFLLPNNEFSQTERRSMANLPGARLHASASNNGFEGNWWRYFNSNALMEDIEVFMQDHFPFREQFRTSNAVMNHWVLQIRDSNGNFFSNGHLAQLNYELDERAINNNARIFANMMRELFPNNNIFYSVIPDKNYFLAAPNGFLHLDYDELMRIIHSHMGEYAEYVDLFEIMSLDDFYRTDIHWRQENLFPVARALAERMGVDLPDPNDFTEYRLPGFRGSWHGAAALPIRPDELVYMASRYTRGVIVNTFDMRRDVMDFVPYISLGGVRHPLVVHDRTIFHSPYSLDGYDLFLAGVQAVMTIDNPYATTDRELIMFRDSFGSNLAPLLIGSYSRITLIDPRLVNHRIIPQIIDIHDNMDVLFLYSSTMFNIRPTPIMAG